MLFVCVWCWCVCLFVVGCILFVGCRFVECSVCCVLFGVLQCVLIGVWCWCWVLFGVWFAVCWLLLVLCVVFVCCLCSLVGFR